MTQPRIHALVQDPQAVAAECRAAAADIRANRAWRWTLADLLEQAAKAIEEQEREGFRGVPLVEPFVDFGKLIGKAPGE